MKWKRM
ncbi:hypothetical protein OIU79_026741 [Salix purpurea]|nr:hypothetical protein OIU79_026741 [Salix purpurea]